MNKRFSLGAAAALSVAMSQGAFAHSVLTHPTPRTNADDYKDTIHHAGSPPNSYGLFAALTDPTTVAPTSLNEGQDVSVTWNETINHEGCFLISLRVGPNGTFKDLKTVAHSAAGGTPRPYSQTVTLPRGETGAGSVLLLRQLMLTGPCPPAQIPTGTTYYSAADIDIVAAAGNAGVDPATLPASSFAPGITPPAGGTDAGAGGGMGGGPGNGTGGGVPDAGTPGGTGTSGGSSGGGFHPGQREPDFRQWTFDIGFVHVGGGRMQSAATSPGLALLLLGAAVLVVRGRRQRA